jgi:hypothetical protein
LDQVLTIIQAGVSSSSKPADGEILAANPGGKANIEVELTELRLRKKDTYRRGESAEQFLKQLGVGLGRGRQVAQPAARFRPCRSDMCLF